MKIDYVKAGDYLIPALTVLNKRHNIGNTKCYAVHSYKNIIVQYIRLS